MVPHLVGIILDRSFFLNSLVHHFVEMCFIKGIYCNFLSALKILLNSREATVSCARNFSIAVKLVAAVSLTVWELFLMEYKP